MRKPIIIGENEFKYKKDAVAYYKAILNSYQFGESLTDEDYHKLFDLLEYGHFFCDEVDADDNSDFPVVSEDFNEVNAVLLTIEDIKVSKVQFNTKCFELFYSDKTSQYISYLMILNQKRFTPDEFFNKACRSSIHNDIRAVKQQFFDENSVKGQVRCQESNILSTWAELVIDHRQPNTFSMIVDRFKELNKIDVSTIEYTTDSHNHVVFQDANLAKAFVSYHKEKARLRLVRKEYNSSRSGMGRVKKTTKDLAIK